MRINVGKALLENNCFLLLFICGVFIFGCKKDEGRIGIPYKIFSLEEIVAGNEIKRTAQVSACRFDDEFHFNSEGELKVFMGHQKCSNDPKNSVGGIWELTAIDNIQGDYMKLNMPFSYIVHDSLTIGQTFSQWQGNNTSQIYKIIELNDSIIIIQNGKDLALPNTQNIWQLTLKID